MSWYEKKQQISKQLKAQFFKDNGIPPPDRDFCFYVFAGANQFKKAIGTIIDSFNKLNKDNALLLLGLKNIECQIGGYKFHGEYDLKELIGHPRVFLIGAILSENAMSRLYKMSDFLLYPSQGEAPGLQMSEAQLSGCIPLATDYTELGKESCFQEFLLNDYLLYRGQFNCYRAIVKLDDMVEKVKNAFNLWQVLNDPKHEDHQKAIARYEQFMADVTKKYQYRTWDQTAAELSSIFQSFKNNHLRIDSELVKL